MLTDLRSPREGTRIKALRALVHVRVSPGADGGGAARARFRERGPARGHRLAPDRLPRTRAESASRRGAFKAENGQHRAGASSRPARSPCCRARWPGELLVDLSSATKDDDARVRTSAAFALGVLGSGALGPRTADVGSRAHDGPRLRAAPSRPGHARGAARATARLFEPPPHASAPAAIGDAVIAALNDDDTRVRLWASDGARVAPRAARGPGAAGSGSSTTSAGRRPRPRCTRSRGSRRRMPPRRSARTSSRWTRRCA